MLAWTSLRAKKEAVGQCMLLAVVVGVEREGSITRTFGSQVSQIAPASKSQCNRIV